MIEIFALHGIVDKPNPDVFCDRNMAAADRLQSKLKSWRKYAPLTKALKGSGKALTIDDATEAGARAALLARSLGHAVTLFVNPWQIEDGRPYAFACLNALLDAVTERTFDWSGQAFSLGSVDGKQIFRSAIKHAMRGHVRPEQNYDLIEEIRINLGVPPLAVPDHLKTLSLERLRQLQAAGVDIQNHYWSHLDPAAHSQAEFAADWRRAQEWLRNRLDVDSTFFASPFGEFFPPREFLQANDITCLLLHNAHPSGAFDTTTVNRINLM